MLGFAQVAETLGKLNAGDEIAVTGTATINQWEKDDDTIRVSLNVMTRQVMTLYQHRKKKKRFAQAPPASVTTNTNDFDDATSAL